MCFSDMAWYPKAERKPIRKAAKNGRIAGPTQIILHSAGGMGELSGWWNNPGSGALVSHFWVGPDGRVVQYVDTVQRAPANGRANGRAISVETSSTVHATEPWTDAQVQAIIELCVWLRRTHPGIAGRQIRHESDPGIGWHIMFGAPGPWTGVRGKVCPGPRRIRQTIDVIIPSVVRDGTNNGNDKKGFLMALTDQEQKALRDKVNGLDLRLRGIADQLERLDKLTREMDAASRTRHGSVRGWLAAIAEKQFGSFQEARKQAVKHDPHTQEK